MYQIAIFKIHVESRRDEPSGIWAYQAHP